ncbi:PIR Superfamily Protein [Plasmodium ovale curtisi]|uniref:PIR Superfamily Protein n=1 Tax=Plasmodium ovale curtisi TaxID=864141 RepID=A0A1A8WL83_PLAOA|nr:PIR Superfamily Protein [Plasmodium ovale curtisi]
MSSQTDSTSFIKLLGYSLKELYSERFYQQREFDELYLNEYSKYCNDIASPKKKNNMKRICKKVLKYLDKSKEYKKNESEYDECILLNYWVYDTLDKYFNHNIEDMKVAFGTLQYIWTPLTESSNSPSFYKKCKPLFEQILHYDDWKKRKELYDYCVNYGLIGPMCRFIDDKCMEYYKYIEEKAELFTHFEDVCTSDSSNCPEIYSKCKEYNPKKVLDTLICHEKIKTQREDAALAIEKNSASYQISGKEQGPGPHTSVTNLEQENSGIGTKVGHSVIGVAPVLLTATALYRYTPIGSWIRNLGGHNQNSINNIDGEMEGFLGNTQESGNMFFDGEENYISYQPM